MVVVAVGARHIGYLTLYHVVRVRRGLRSEKCASGGQTKATHVTGACIRRNPARTGSRHHGFDTERGGGSAGFQNTVGGQVDKTPDWPSSLDSRGFKAVTTRLRSLAAVVR